MVTLRHATAKTFFAFEFHCRLKEVCVQPQLHISASCFALCLPECCSELSKQRFIRGQ